MIHKPILSLCLFVMTANGVVAAAPPNQPDVVHFAIGEWAPYTSERQGTLEKIIRQIYTSQGYEVRYSYHPWVRSTKLVEHEKADATFPWYSNEARRQIFYQSPTPIVFAETVIFYRESMPIRWGAISDLANYRIGGVEGFSSTLLLRQHKVFPLISSNQKENFHKLHRGRIDAVPAEKRVGRLLINQVTGYDERVIMTDPKPLLSEPMFLLFQKTPRGKALLDAYEDGMKKLIANGCYEKMLDDQECP